MPTPKKTRYRATKSFDFIPRPNVVRTFVKGQEYDGLTVAMIERGLEIGALEEITSQEDHSNGKA